MSQAAAAQPELDPDQLREEAFRLLEAARGEGIELRLLGALAFELQCPTYLSLREQLGRLLSDLDFVSLSSRWQDLIDFMERMGYSFDDRYGMLHGNERLIFFHENGFRVDIFLDRLDMCHVIDFRGRMHLDANTISITDLLLEKLQIVQLTQKDVIDMLVLFLEHDVGDSEQTIHAGYVAELLAADWGFYYTATENLRHLRNEGVESFETLTSQQRETIGTRIDKLLKRIEGAPKTRRWRLRAAIGPRLRWYKEVGDLER